MVVDGYCWTHVPGTDIEVRALATTPLALRYRPRGTAANSVDLLITGLGDPQ